MGFAQTLNVVLLPLAIIGAGLLFAWKRKERNAEGRGNAL
jgi:LPXTG-motif cell wall-anchored protein